MLRTALILAAAVLGFAQAQEGCSSKKAGNGKREVPAVNVNRPVRPPPASTGRPTGFLPLPGNIEPDTKVRLDVKDKNGKVVSSKVVTVLEALNELKARHVGDKLVDQNGREIKFFEPMCRGVSAGTDEDEAARKAKEKELAELEKNFTVIVLYCDPGSVM